ncbi:MAG: NUDIX hydrolase [Methyloligellaceae bacterium]
MEVSPIRPTPGASIAVFDRNKVLLVQRGKVRMRHIWSLPGGHIKPGETSDATALRELYEEAGIHADLLGLVTSHDVILRDDQDILTAHYVLSVYYGIWTSGTARAGSDSIAVRWITPQDIPNLETTSGLQQIVNKAHRLLKGSIQ